MPTVRGVVLLRAAITCKYRQKIQYRQEVHLNEGASYGVSYMDNTARASDNNPQNFKRFYKRKAA